MNGGKAARGATPSLFDEPIERIPAASPPAASPPAVLQTSADALAAPLAPAASSSLDDAQVEIVRSTRARRVSVRVDRVTGRVRVTLPQRAPLAEVDRALLRHRRWIAARLAEAAAVRAQVQARGDCVLAWGEPLQLAPEPGRQRVHRRGDQLLVPEGGDGAALERWLRAQARARLVPLTEAAARQLGRPLARVSIGDAKTRWGSCTAKGTITYSWRLVIAPPWVAEAIVWHEACHLVHLNHSARFWNLLRAHEPRTDDARRWLRDHGATLVLPATHAAPAV